MRRGASRKGFSSFLRGLVLLVALVIAVMPVVRAGAENTSSELSYRVITPDELKSMLAHKDFILINVSFRCTGYIPGTDREIPFNAIERYVDTLPPADEAKIVLYCNRGYMSRVAAGKLVKMGYPYVYVLKGGLEAWKLAGNRVVKR
ncbi:MAG: rhodanese-like domain-containing protein [Deltaproteobacteria bacterium]|nr:MAG: rhodanese-like domain-containing protein [Deltaproteobacteria bacterium]